MAEQIISPAVYMTEYDQAYLPQAVGNIGAAIIGPTSRGRGFIPTIVTSYTDFMEKFGGANDDTYVPYAVKAYLENTGTMTIVRTLGLYGYKVLNIPLLLTAPISATGSGLKVAAILHPTYRTYTDDGSGLAYSLITSSLAANSFVPSTGYASASYFDLVLSGSSNFGAAYNINAVTLDPTEANYIGKALGLSPKANTINGAYAYRYCTFDNYCNSLMSSSEALGGTSTAVVKLDTTIDLNLSSSNGSEIYKEASTPWIKSQLTNGVSHPLFQVCTQAQGQDVNKAYKIAILNVKRAGEVPGSNYGSFTLLVRDYSDTDKAPKVLETYTDLNLDPTSPNFISRVIGDKYATYNSTYKKIVYTGDYNNKSKFIYIKPADDVKTQTYSPSLVPYGFAAVTEPIILPTNVTFPTASMITEQKANGAYNSKVYYGFDYNLDTTDNANYLMPIAVNATTGSNDDFVLDKYFSDASSTGNGCSLSSSLAPLSARKFIVPMQGGFDGFNPSKRKATGTDISTTNAMGFDFSTSTSDGYLAYKQAIDLLANATQFDINMLLTPGILDYYHSNVISYAVDMCESRGDCFYIFDSTKMDSLMVEDATEQTANYDTNYAATYYPWIKIFDSEQNKYIWTPPSVPVAGAISYNDKIGFEWYAPAGLNRGSLSTARDVYNNLSKPEIDVLYDGKVNAIASFPNEGIAVWGQKNTSI